MNTYIGKYIVSTVGEWNLDRVGKEIHAKIYDNKWFLENKDKLGDDFENAYMKRFGFGEIGFGRKYETMVFKAKKSKNKCCLYEASDYSGLDMRSYNKPEDAYKGHLAMCKKWFKR